MADVLTDSSSAETSEDGIKDLVPTETNPLPLLKLPQIKAREKFQAKRRCRSHETAWTFGNKSETEATTLEIEFNQIISLLKESLTRTDLQTGLIYTLLDSNHSILGFLKEKYTEDRTSHERHKPREKAHTPPEHENDKATVNSPDYHHSSDIPTGCNIKDSNVFIGQDNKVVNKTVDNSVTNTNNTYNYSVEVHISTTNHELEGVLLQAISMEPNQVCESRKQMKEFFQSNCRGVFKEAHEGSIVLVFLTDNIGLFREGFARHEEQIKRLIEKWFSELLRGTKYSHTTYSICIKLEGDIQECSKDNSSTSASFDSKKDVQNNDKDIDENDDGKDEGKDDNDKGAASTKNSVKDTTQAVERKGRSGKKGGKGNSAKDTAQEGERWDRSKKNGGKANGRDGRGVERGKCKGCNECLEFRGKMKCENCNCTATQHVNLTEPQSDPGTTTRLSQAGRKGNSWRGKDGRGTQRGACKVCNECVMFEGDLSCEYCTCAATQHVNLTDVSSDTKAFTSAKGTSRPVILLGNYLSILTEDTSALKILEKELEMEDSDHDCMGHIIEKREREATIELQLEIAEKICKEQALKDLIAIKALPKEDFYRKYIKDIPEKILSTRVIARSYPQRSRRYYNLNIGLRYSNGDIDEGTITDFESRFNNTIQNKRREIEADVRTLLDANLEDIRFKDGSILIKISMDQSELEDTVIQRQNVTEKYMSHLVQHVFPFDFSNNSHERGLCLDIKMDGVFENTITLAAPRASRRKLANEMTSNSLVDDWESSVSTIFIK